jgi:hypothetical protein
MCPDEPGGLRPLSAPEMDLLQRLVSADFQGAEALRRQLADTLVEPIDRDGSLRLRPVDPTPAAVSRRIPVEATYADADGVLVHVLIHVINGALHELEVYREDSGAVVVAPPDASSLEVEPWVE